MTDPDEIELRALDVIPYRFGMWCTIAGSMPFVNPIVHRSWSEDGECIWLMLDSHNFQQAKPDAMLKVVPLECRHEPFDPKQADNAAFIAARPKPKHKCPHCDGKGFVAEP